MKRILLLVIVAGCASRPRDADPGLEVQSHAHEVPRIPNPAYIPDGALITRMDGASVWAKAGLAVNDVIESVNGSWTPDADAFRKAALAKPPRGVRIVSSRAGPVGRYRLVSIEVS